MGFNKFTNSLLQFVSQSLSSWCCLTHSISFHLYLVCSKKIKQIIKLNPHPKSHDETIANPRLNPHHHHNHNHHHHHHTRAKSQPFRNTTAAINPNNNANATNNNANANNNATTSAGDPRTLAAASATVQANNLLNQIASSKLTAVASPSEVPQPLPPTDTSDGVPVPPVTTSPAATSTGSRAAAQKAEEGVKQITTTTNNLANATSTTTSTANVAATTGGGGPGGGGCNMANVMLQCPATRQNHRLFSKR